MRKLSLILLGSLSVLALVVMTAGAADACDGKNAAAKTAKAETAEAKVAKAGSCSATKTAAAEAKVAKTGSCSASKTAAVDATVAGAGCTKSATAMKTAGSSCSSKTADAAVAIETVRMPSGALAVFYNGKTEAAVAGLHEKFEAKGASFGCNLAAGMASDENCKVEGAVTEHGIMLLVSSEKSDVIDEYQSAYQVASAAHAQAASDGE